MMTQHRTKDICSVHNTKSSNLKLSSKQPGGTSSKLIGQHALNATHIYVNMNLNKRWQMSKKQKRTNHLNINPKAKNETLLHETKWLCFRRHQTIRCLFLFIWCKQVSIIFCPYNECRRNFCWKVIKIIEKEITKVEQRKRRETKITT
jgi:hypothetical protein